MEFDCQDCALPEKLGGYQRKSDSKAEKIQNVRVGDFEIGLNFQGFVQIPEKLTYSAPLTRSNISIPRI